MPWYYNISRLVARITLFLLICRQVRGVENVPGQGPLLIVSNHLSLADPPLLNISFRRQVKFMAKAKLFRFKPFGYFLRGLGAFPVRQGKPDRKALHEAEQVLGQGFALVIFPEGMRSRSGRLRQPFSGATLVALRSGAPILPVGITGTEKLERFPWLLRRPRATVNIGSPFYLPPVSSKLTSVKLDELTNYIMQHVARLLPEEYRGNYAREIRWH